jgi:hypothetical protein
VQGSSHGSSFSFLQADSHFFPATFFEEAVFSPLYVFGAFVKNKVGILFQYYAVFIAMVL